MYICTSVEVYEGCAYYLEARSRNCIHWLISVLHSICILHLYILLFYIFDFTSDLSQEFHCSTVSAVGLGTAPFFFGFFNS